jgi:hypothetical protein
MTTIKLLSVDKEGSKGLSQADDLWLRKLLTLIELYASEFRNLDKDKVLELVIKIRSYIEHTDESRKHQEYTRTHPSQDDASDGSN